MKKDCWWNESARSGKDTAFLETPITPAANTTTEPPITGMWTRFDEEAVPGPAQWLYSVTKREPRHNDFLIDSAAATSVCQRSLIAWEANPVDLKWNSDRPLDISPLRRGAR